MMTTIQSLPLLVNQRQARVFYWIICLIPTVCFQLIIVLVGKVVKEFPLLRELCRLVRIMIMGRISNVLCWIVKGLEHFKAVMIEIVNYLLLICCFHLWSFTIVWALLMSKLWITFRWLLKLVKCFKNSYKKAILCLHYFGC